MRLLCCSGTLEGGGSERQLWRLATQIDTSRFAPHIYLLHRRGVFLEQVPARVPIHAFEADEPQRQRHLPGQIFARQVRHLQRAIEKQQIDIVYDRTFHMTLVTSRACRRTKTPRVSVIVSPPSQDFSRSRERWRWLKKWMLSRAYRSPSDTTLAVSNSVAEDAATFYRLQRERILVIPNPVDVPSVESAAQATVPSNPMAPAAQASSTLRLVVVGRLSQEKGQRRVIEAVSALVQRRPEMKIYLDIVGDGPDRAQLEQLASTLHLESLVCFHGFLRNPYPIIRSASLLCLPSDYEGLPNVMLEAMVLKTPVVATDCSGSVKDAIGDQQRGILVPVGDVQALARALLESVDNRLQTRQRAEAAYDWVIERHSLPPWLERMQRLFSDKVTARGRERAS